MLTEPTPTRARRQVDQVEDEADDDAEEAAPDLAAPTRAGVTLKKRRCLTAAVTRLCAADRDAGAAPAPAPAAAAPNQRWAAPAMGAALELRRPPATDTAMERTALLIRAESKNREVRGQRDESVLVQLLLCWPARDRWSVYCILGGGGFVVVSSVELAALGWQEREMR